MKDYIKDFKSYSEEEIQKKFEERLKNRAYERIMKYGSCTREMVYAYALEEIGWWVPKEEWELENESRIFKFDISLLNPEESE